MKLRLMLAAMPIISTVLNVTAGDYTVKGELPDREGATVYLHDYDSRTNIDSAKVVNGRFVMTGSCEWPMLARVESGVSFSNCILDSVVTVDFATHAPYYGSELNRKFLEYFRSKEAINDELQRFSEELSAHGFVQPQLGEIYKMLVDKKLPEMIAILENAIKNNDNGIGQEAMMSYSPIVSGVTPDMWNTIKDSIPAGLKSTRLYADRDSQFANIRKSAVGQPFIDFPAQTPDGKNVKFSDYVGKGKYVLVDFWASWCGPCLAEAKTVLKPLYDRLKGNDKFEILGVGVWDSADKLSTAIEKDGNAWAQIFADGMQPMELYGFDYIPMIILFSPDGTIMERGLRGDRLVSTVESVLSE